MTEHITWQPPEEHVQASNQGYRVSKTLTRGVPVYTAWPPKPAYNKYTNNWVDNLHSCLSCHSSAAAARAACEAHASQSASGSPSVGNKGNTSTNAASPC